MPLGNVEVGVRVSLRRSGRLDGEMLCAEPPGTQRLRGRDRSHPGDEAPHRDGGGFGDPADQRPGEQHLLCDHGAAGRRHAAHA